MNIFFEIEIYSHCYYYYLTSEKTEKRKNNKYKRTKLKNFIIIIFQFFKSVVFRTAITKEKEKEKGINKIMRV